MRKNYRLLTAAALFTATALTTASAAELSLQRFKSGSKNSAGNTFWFPALYSEAPCNAVYVKVAELLKFGLSGDLRDKSISKTDLERLVTALDSKGYGQLKQTTTTPKFYYKDSKLGLHLAGGVAGKVPFAVTGEQQAQQAGYQG